MNEPLQTMSSTDQTCDPYIFDTRHFEDLLCANAERMLVNDADTQIKLIEVGSKDRIFTQHDDLKAYMDSAKAGGTRIFLVPQKFSWDRLAISENTMRLLLDRLHIFPAFINILCAFGKRTHENSDSLGGCYNWRANGISEMCYLLRTAERHGRDNCDEPWSIRQMGVYHQYNAVTGGNTFILLNPLITLQHRLRDARKRSSHSLNSHDIHNLVLSHSTWQWRWYLTFWETNLAKLSSKAHVSEVATSPKQTHVPMLTIGYSDFQDVQVIHDRLNASKSILSSNTLVCNELSASLIGGAAINLFAHELRLQSNRADNLLERAKSSSALMQHIISFRGLDSLRTSSENSNEMARLAEIDTKNMVKLTSKSQKDAATLKKITWLTCVYLPASFVSQFLSMGYLTVNAKKKPPALNFAADLWIFVVLTVLLLALTFAAWLCLDLPKERRWWRRKTLTLHAAADDKV